MIVTFCGHANFCKTEAAAQKIINFMEEKVGENRADMYLGGYGNFDSLAYDCCKRYQKIHPKVSLIFITPYLTEEYQKNHLNYQATRYDSVLYPALEDKPVKFAISYRNKWMIDKADIVICGIDHSWGGAYKTYMYAKKRNKLIFNVTNKEF